MNNLAPRALLIAADLPDRQVVARAIGSDFIKVVTDVEAVLRKVGASAAYDLILYELREGWPSGRELHDAIARAYPQAPPLLALITADPELEEAYSAAGICVLLKPLSESMMASLLGLLATEATERKAS